MKTCKVLRTELSILEALHVSGVALRAQIPACPLRPSPGSSPGMMTHTAPEGTAKAHVLQSGPWGPLAAQDTWLTFLSTLDTKTESQAKSCSHP